MVEQILILLFIGFWLIELKKKRNIIEQNSIYISILAHLLDRAYEFVPEDEEELLSQIEELIYYEEDNKED